ncbi:MAG: DUF5320 domain-containing protein [Candidatus Omnitrophica bacterium]|nr:DUF5320 domain-containing protein [Candidatus Omnitrophota bacterium]
MPGGDGTGPAGLGPMTGRAAGYCAGYSVPGYMNPIPGRGYFGGGRGFAGRGGGRGRRNWYYATGLSGWARAAQGLPAWGGGGSGVSSPQQEADFLKQQAQAIQEELKSINQRITELESTAKNEQK